MSDVIQFNQVDRPFGFLSNFHAGNPIDLAGKLWPTVEHYFQAMKFPDDPSWQERIRAAKKPKLAKAIAWEKDAPVRRDWDRVRDGVMLEGLRAKFTQHEDLAKLLIGTGDAILVEHCKDTYWGDAMDGSGANRLGQLLMQVREEIRGT